MCLICYENDTYKQIIINHDTDVRDYLESKNVSNDIIKYIEDVFTECEELEQANYEIEKENKHVQDDYEEQLADTENELDNLSQDFSTFIEDITDKIIEIGIANSSKIELLEYIINCQNHDKLYTERELRCFKTELELRNSEDEYAKAFATELPF